MSQKRKKMIIRQGSFETMVDLPGREQSSTSEMSISSERSAYYQGGGAAAAAGEPPRKRSITDNSGGGRRGRPMLIRHRSFSFNVDTGGGSGTYSAGYSSGSAGSDLTLSARGGELFLLLLSAGMTQYFTNLIILFNDYYFRSRQWQRRCGFCCG